MSEFVSELMCRGNCSLVEICEKFVHVAFLKVAIAFKPTIWFWAANFGFFPFKKQSKVEGSSASFFLIAVFDAGFYHTPNTTPLHIGRLLPSPLERGERIVSLLKKYCGGEAKTWLRENLQMCSDLKFFLWAHIFSLKEILWRARPEPGSEKTSKCVVL